MNSDIRELINKLDRIAEGEIGQKIGSTIGGIFGKDAGDRLGQIGSNIGDIFDKSTSGISSKTTQPSGKDASGKDSGKFMALGPDNKTMTSLSPAADGSGFGQYHPQKPKDDAAGVRRDMYGNKDGDYIEQSTVSIKGTIGLKGPGSFADEIQKINVTRGTGLKLTQSWDFKNSTLALLEAERGGSSGPNGNTTIWSPIASASAFDMGDEMARMYAKHGYKMVSDKDSATSASMGVFRTEETRLSKGILSKDIVIRNSMIKYAFESAQGKGLHLIECTFIGSASDYASGGLEAFTALLNSLGPSPGTKPLTPKQ